MCTPCSDLFPKHNGPVTFVKDIRLKDPVFVQKMAEIDKTLNVIDEEVVNESHTVPTKAGEFKPDCPIIIKKWQHLVEVATMFHDV